MSIYHLHIPRTSGGFVRSLLVDSRHFKNNVVGHYRTISENDFENADLISGHYGTNPISFVDKTFAIIRNPSELTFSYIKYLSMVPGGKSFNEDSIKRYLGEEDLRKSVTNVSSQFLSLKLNFESYNENIHDHISMANNSWYLEGKEFSADTAIDSILKNNIYTFVYESTTLYDDILNMLGIRTEVNKEKKVNKSFADETGLYKKYFNEINAANDKDNILYERLIDVHLL